MDEVASQMQREIDNYIVHAVNPKHADFDRKSVVQDLSRFSARSPTGHPLRSYWTPQTDAP